MEHRRRAAGRRRYLFHSCRRPEHMHTCDIEFSCQFSVSFLFSFEAFCLSLLVLTGEGKESYSAPYDSDPEYRHQVDNDPEVEGCPFCGRNTYLNRAYAVPILARRYHAFSCTCDGQERRRFCERSGARFPCFSDAHSQSRVDGGWKIFGDLL